MAQWIMILKILGMGCLTVIAVGVLLVLLACLAAVVKSFFENK